MEVTEWVWGKRSALCFSASQAAEENRGGSAVLELSLQ